MSVRCPWQALTGGSARRADSGRNFDDLAREGLSAEPYSVSGFACVCEVAILTTIIGKLTILVSGLLKNLS
jgi:hypothetical protein